MFVKFYVKQVQISHRALYRLLFLALIAVILLSPLAYWSTGIGQTAANLSADVVRQADGSLLNSPKAGARHSLLLPIRIQRMLMYPLLLLSFQLSGGAAALRRWTEAQVTALSSSRAAAWGRQITGPLGRMTGFLPLTWRQRLPGYDLWVIVLFIVVFQLGLFLLYLPFNFYRSFVLAHQFGLSTQTVSGWLNDWFKSVLVILTTDGLMWTGFYALIRLFPRRWPVPGGALLFLFIVVFTLLSPILITPLFFEVKSLDDPNLSERIMVLAERAGMPVSDIEVIDASTKTTQVNAYVAGFGGAQRMVVYDTLLQGYTADEVEVVLAHELGHWFHRHVLWSVLGLGAAGWLGLLGLRWLLSRTWSALTLRGPADVAGLPYVMAIIAIASILSLPIQNGISRYAETQADEFALAVTQKPDVFISLFTQLAEQNLSLVNPPRWEKFIFYTHPSTVDRISRAEKHD